LLRWMVPANSKFDYPGCNSISQILSHPEYD
jgi:hypothetical protein